MFSDVAHDQKEGGTGMSHHQKDGEGQRLFYSFGSRSSLNAVPRQDQRPSTEIHSQDLCRTLLLTEG